ncbi:hypothetical protein [Streptomyces sp. NPDC002082]|uniref:hypothetical protein n=1 Tax=Streptomyces sp. NPDC002082 TaxID=3154772 RepID=UPI003322CCC2
MGAGTDVPGDGRSNVLVRDLVRSVVADLAPEELPIVDGLRQFDDAAVRRRLRGRRARREPLGFGIGEIAVLVTPVVWLVLDGVAQRLAAAAADRTAQGVTGTLSRLLGRRTPAVEVPPLTREQLAEVRALVMAAAGQRGLPPERAEAIADAVVARLALSVGAGGALPGDPPLPAVPDGPPAPGISTVQATEQA